MPVTSATLTIGQVARASGPTAKALRHYDAIGLLPPADVDGSGYRRYGPEQVQRARQIRVLRELELPLDDIGRIVADADALATVVAAHRTRVHARLTRLQTVHYLLGTPLEGKEIEHAMPARPESVSLEPDQQRQVAVELFNHTWTLMEKPDRSEPETELMLHAAHASRFFWEEIGEPVNRVRGEWLLARAYAVAGRAEPALHHAQRSLSLCEEHGIGDFDLAFAQEALARAHAVAGDSATAAEHERLARAAADGIAEAEDRELLLSDLETLP
jgi:DNA-binding transcriptional MerR regulator